MEEPEDTRNVTQVSRPLFIGVVEDLIRDIEDRKFPAGTQIPSEVELSKRFAVSRTTIREALSVMHFNGYLESRQGAKRVVKENNTIAENAAREITESVVFDALESRAVIEPRAMVLIAKEGSTRKRANAVISGMELTLKYHYKVHNGDIEFHREMAKLCPNSIIEKQLQTTLEMQTGDIWRRTRKSIWNESRTPNDWVEQHRSIIMAIEKGDAQSSSTLAAEHLCSVIDSVLQYGISKSSENQQRGKELISWLADTYRKSY